MPSIPGKDLLQRLIETPSPSGFESAIQEIVQKAFATSCDTIRTDVNGNVIGILNPNAPTRVMISAHCDEIGLMVIHIDERGFLTFSAVGGVDPAVLPGQRVKVHTATGPIPGVIGRKPIHHIEPDDRGKVTKMQDLWIDIGAADGAGAKRLVAVGTYVTIDTSLTLLANRKATARGFDNRIGLFVLLRTMAALHAKRPRVGVYAVSSVQEEIGARGAQTATFGIDPHIGIAVDVGHASDYPGGDPRRAGECSLGKGAIVYSGPNLHPAITRQFQAQAARSRIPIQNLADPGPTPTDARVIQISRAGVPTGLIKVPLRYMHTPSETLSLDDADAATKLLTGFIMRLSPRNPLGTSA